MFYLYQVNAISWRHNSATQYNIITALGLPDTILLYSKTRHVSNFWQRAQVSTKYHATSHRRTTSLLGCKRIKMAKLRQSRNYTLHPAVWIFSRAVLLLQFSFLTFKNIYLITQNENWENILVYPGKYFRISSPCVKQDHKTKHPIPTAKPVPQNYRSLQTVAFTNGSANVILHHTTFYNKVSSSCKRKDSNGLRDQ